MTNPFISKRWYDRQKRRSEALRLDNEASAAARVREKSGSHSVKLVDIYEKAAKKWQTTNDYVYAGENYRRAYLLAREINKEKPGTIGAERIRELESHVSSGMGGNRFVFLTITFITFLFGIFFLSGNITGNVVGGLNQVSLNWIGILLLVLGLVEVFFILKKNKNF